MPPSADNRQEIEDIIHRTLDDAKAILNRFAEDQASLAAVGDAVRLFCKSFEAGGRVYACGNGGSMCDAMHFAEELSGRFRHDRRALAAVAISDPGYMSCVANDFGYDQVFSRFIEAHGRPGDCLLAISTSGRSENVLAAARAARKIGVKVVGLSGNRQSDLDQCVDIHVATPTNPYADRIQELHIKVIHAIIEGIEKTMFG